MKIGKWLRGIVFTPILFTFQTQANVLPSQERVILGTTQQRNGVELYLGLRDKSSLPYSFILFKRKFLNALNHTKALNSEKLNIQSLEVALNIILEEVKTIKQYVPKPDEILIMALSKYSRLFPNKQNEIENFLNKYRLQSNFLFSLPEYLLQEEKGVLTEELKNIANKYNSKGDILDYEFELVFLYIRSILKDYTNYKKSENNMKIFDSSNDNETKRISYNLISVLLDNVKETIKTFEKYKIGGKSSEQFLNDINFYVGRFEESYLIPEFKDYLKSKEAEINIVMRGDKEKIRVLLINKIDNLYIEIAKINYDFDLSQEKKKSQIKDKNMIFMLEIGKFFFENNKNNIFISLLRKISNSYNDLEIIDNREGKNFEISGSNKSQIKFIITNSGIEIYFNLYNVNEQAVQILIEESNKLGIDPLIAIGKSIIESNLCNSETTISSSGAEGCLQVKEVAYNELKRIGKLKNFPEKYENTTLHQKLVAGIYYIKYLEERFNLSLTSSSFEDLVMLAIGYNAGPSKLISSARKAKKSGRFDLKDETLIYYQHLVILLKKVKVVLNKPTN